MILVDCARALARSDDRDTTLRTMLQTTAEGFEVGSAVVVVPGERSDGHEIAASFGVDAAAAAGLAAAMGRPGHPITRTFDDPWPTFGVAPVNPGGPALRSHLPLIVRRDGADRVVGVLALAHERPFDSDVLPVLEAVADLAAVAIDRD